MSPSDRPRSPATRTQPAELESTHITSEPLLDETQASDDLASGVSATHVGPTQVSSQSGASQSSSRVTKSTPKVGGSTKAPTSGGPIGPHGLDQIGDYRLIRKLGQGGMGEVYLAHQLSLDRPAALKVLAKHLADKPDFVKRFYREARAMAKIDHPQTVRVFAVDEADGIHFVAMEFVDGKSLQDWMRQLGTLSVGDAVHIILRCAEALEVAHDINMVHRDIKPDNIMLTRRGQVKVSDFGLAKALDDEDMSMTQSGTGLGTPYYMAPEQARNAKHVDRRSDIYALGITFFQILTGKLPFTGDSAMEVVLAKEKGFYEPARKLNPAIPDKLDLIVGKMIDKKVDQRFQDCGELIRVLAGLGLENSSLSFIDAPDKVTVSAAKSAAAQSNPRLQRSATVTKPMASGRLEALAATREEQPDLAWQVEFRKPDGQKTIVKCSTAQVLQMLRNGTIDNRAKARKKNADPLIPIAQFPEFAQTVQGLLIKQKADKQGGQTKKLLQNYRWHEFTYRVKKWFLGLFRSVMGIVSFVLYLAILGGLAYGAYYYWMNYGRQQLQNAIPGSPTQSAQPASTATPETPTPSPGG
ncbi:protein kinase [bacterium]|nr:protein kinase [bacterium]